MVRVVRGLGFGSLTLTIATVIACASGEDVGPIVQSNNGNGSQTGSNGGNGCNEGFTGAVCDMCAPGYFGADCAPCKCVNGTCNDGPGGDGKCSSCAEGWTGENCDTCAEGYFGNECGACSCVNGACNGGFTGDGSCLSCEAGWRGELCDEEVPLGDGDVTLSGNANLSLLSHEGRSCADGGDMISYAVTALTNGSATLAKAPADGCLTAGDEVLLINLQGNGANVANVGNYEFLKVASVTDGTVTFADAKVNSYGSSAGSDDGVGTAGTQQRVILQRVPNYGTFSVEAAAQVTAAAWDGTLGGVFALRATTAQIDGTIDMSAKGYTGGVRNTLISRDGQQGESLGGLGTADTAPNAGGGGGGGGDPGMAMACPPYGVSAGGGGHRYAGATGALSGACVGGGGQLYGDDDLAQIFFGSGGGAGGTDNVLSDNPPGGAGGAGGGIIMIFADTITGSGSILARGGDGVGDTAGFECPMASGMSADDCFDYCGAGGGGAGGTISLTAATRTLDGEVSVGGGAGGNALDGQPGDGGAGGLGRLVTGAP